MFLTDSLGRWLWYGAFACQLLWHLSATADLLTSDLPAEAQGRYLVRAWNFTSRFLPSTESLIRLSLQMTVLGIWWNPKFPEIVRGFSRPILGLPKWYAFQAILAVARYLFPKIVQLDVERAEQATAQLAIHAFVAGLISYVSFYYPSSMESIAPVSRSNPCLFLGLRTCSKERKARYYPLICIGRNDHTTAKDYSDQGEQGKVFYDDTKPFGRP